MIFLLLGGLLPVQGLRMHLNPPTTAELPGVNQRTVAMAVDATGLGAPVVDMLRAARLSCDISAVNITGGDQQSRLLTR